MYSNMGFWTPAYNSCYLHMSSNNQTCVHTRLLSNADCNANMPNVSLCNGGDVIHRRAVMITANALTSSNNYALVCKLQITSDTTFQDGQYNRAPRICNANFTNSMEIQIENTASGAVFIGSTTSSALKYGTGNSTKMTLTTDGRLGIGTTSPRAGLEVIGTYTYTITNITTNTYIYSVSNNGWANLGGGPVSISICAFFNDDIYVNNSVYTSSDRRLKENIQKLDLDINRYKLLEPMTYRYKKQPDRPKVGLIAQNVKDVCGEAITFTENSNLRVEEDGDIDGVQLGLDYNAITILNLSIVKKLIKRVEDLEKKIFGDT
ncbi:hypothetical protein PC112_g23919 [Phytophthora cactorum]|nr:hypothetical protein PC112_g23919 [Phytophthora cactorum]